MKRTELVETLKTAQPAISTKDFVPAFGCYFFDQQGVEAYDDIVAVFCPMPVPLGIEGGLSGRLLLEFLNASRAAEVEAQAEESVATIKAGRGKLKLPILPPTDFLFQWPEDEGQVVKVSDALFRAVGACALSIGLDPSRPHLLGVTMEFGKKALNCYSTDNVSLSACSVPGGSSPALAKLGGVILPVRFTELVLARRPEKLLIGDGWVQALYPGGGRIHSRTISDCKPETFRQVLGAHSGKGSHPIPKGLDGAIERSMVVLGGDDRQHSTLAVKAGRLWLKTVGPIGEATDYVKFPDHPEVQVQVRPAILRRGLKHSAFLDITDRSVILSGDGYRYVVSVAT